MARADFNRVAAVYDAGRGLPDETMETWREVVSRYLPAPIEAPGLDLGCGTGRFTSALADWFDAEIVGVDPADEMLRVARDTVSDPRVAYVRGRAEAIPLRESACGFAWLSTVIHHVDLPATTRELRRVLKPGATVLVRSWFPGRGDVTHFRYFPRAKEIAETFPTVEQAEAAFAATGFGVKALESVAQVSAPGLRAFAERVRTRADTTLLALSDEEFEAGLRTLEAEAAAETTEEPVISHLDLMVLR